MGPDASSATERLQRAALELFAARGFEHVTAAQIAERAGLARRTFFRCFPDKREVLFARSDELEAALAAAVGEIDPEAAPLAAAMRALAWVGQQLADQAEGAQVRRRVIAASPELQERERSKLAGLAAALAGALEDRGVGPAQAALLAHVAIAAFDAAWHRWLDGPPGERFDRCLTWATEELRAALS